MTAVARKPRGVRRRRIETVVRDKDLVARRHEEIFGGEPRLHLARLPPRHGAPDRAGGRAEPRGPVRLHQDQGGHALPGVREADGGAARQYSPGHPRRHRRSRGADARGPLTVGPLPTSPQRYQDAVLLMYQETKSLGPRSLQLPSSTRRRGTCSSSSKSCRGATTAASSRARPAARRRHHRLLVCSIVALRRWNLRRRFPSEEIRDGLVAFILRALASLTFLKRSHHASAPVARA